MKKLFAELLIIMVLLSVSSPAMSRNADYPPLEPGKGRLILAYKHPLEKIAVRKISDKFFIGTGMTDPKGCVPDSVIKDLRKNGISYFLLFTSWASVEPSMGNYNGYFCGRNLCPYLKKSGAILNGHCLLFLVNESYSVPSFAYGLSFEKQKEEIERYIKATVKAYPDIDYWDLNEPIVQNVFNWTREQVYDVFVSASEWIHEANPNAKVMINMIPMPCNWSGLDYDPNQVMDDLISRGLKADVIGIELYYWWARPFNCDKNGYPKMSWVKSIVDTFRKYNLPIIFSEVGVPPVVDGKLQLEEQADWAEDFFRFCHSDSSVIGATWYFVRDDKTFNFGLANDDWSYRAVATRLFKLANEWNPVTEYYLNAGSYVDLDPGEYDVMINGDVTRITLSDGQKLVFADEIPPDISISSPVENSTTENDTVLIEGKANDYQSGIDKVTVNGVEVSVSSDGSFSKTINLTEGINGITIVAKDNAGNETKKTLAVTYKKPVQKIFIILQIGNTSFTVNGVTNTFDAPPVIKNNRTLLPIRAVVEALGGTVSWDATERKVTITLSSTTIELWIGKNTAMVNSVNKPIDPSNNKVVPEIINSRTMLPLRFVAENIGATVEWDGTNQTITITYQP